jgi:predicted TIM-barrel fold metal-dependent hydrolase
MKVIDFHTHLFPDDLAPRAIDKLVVNAPAGRSFTDGTANGLRKSMHSNGIGYSVILPIATHKDHVITINKAQSVLDRTGFIPFGTIHPQTDDIEGVITFLRQHRIAGIKLHPEYQDFYSDNPRYFPLYEALEAAGIITVFHAGKDPGPFSSDHVLPPALKKIRSGFPRLKMVAAHMGGWQVWQQALDELCGLPLYFDTSAIYGLIDRSLFLKMVQKHGAEWILFGSDSPWFDQGVACGWIESLPLHDHEKEQIFYLNAELLLATG